MNILFVINNPLSNRQIYDKYISLKEGFKGCNYHFLLTPLITDLTRAVADKPNIIHFIGDNTNEGVTVTNNENKPQVITTTILLRLLKSDGLQLVMLEGCYTKEQAQAISNLGIYVVGEGSDKDYVNLHKDIHITNSIATSIATIVNNTTLSVWKDGVEINI